MSRRSAVLSLVVAATQSASAGPCAPRAHLDGDAEAVARVTAALASLGIEVGTPRGDGCPVVVAAVELDRRGGIAVAVRDRTNRSEGRVVSDAALAAAWIDSWIHDDFAPEAAPPLSPPSAVSAPAPAPVEPPRAEASVLDRFALDGGYLRTFALDGTGGSGFAAAACVRTGALCVGARVRVSQLDVAPGATRDDLAVTATASWSHPVGNVVLAPELEGGVGRMTTDACPPSPPCDPTTMMCAPPPPCVNAGVHAETYTPRLGASLRASLPLFAHVWLEGTAAVVVAPFGHGAPFPGSTDPAGNVMPGALPGEPAASAQLGVGVRVGLP